MDSAKIFALGLAAGLAIHVVVRKNTSSQNKEQASEIRSVQPQPSIASKSAKKNKNKKNKSKDPAAGSAPPPPPPAPAQAPTSAPVAPAENEQLQAPPALSKKSKKKQKQQQQQLSQQSTPTGLDNKADENGSSHGNGNGGVVELNNDTVRARSDAAQTAFTASLGDMRDTDVDPLPAGYSSVARIPAPEVQTPKPRLSKQELDEGWSSVGGTFASSSSTSFANTAAKLNGSSSAHAVSGGKNPGSIASNNPFAALPDDATTSSVRRIATPTLHNGSNANAKPNGQGGWTIASSKSKNIPATAAETKKQRSNANKAQAKKAAKEEADRLQAQRLANHRREQALDLAKQRQMATRPTPHSSHASTKLPTAKASVDLNGRLVWD